MSFSQCPRKLWLEHRRTWVPEVDAGAQRRMKEGVQVGDLARRALGPEMLWPTIDTDNAAQAADAARTLLADNPGLPAVEVPMVYANVYARADALIPDAGGYVLRETKAVSYPLNKDKTGPGKPDAHLVLDAAIQAWVMANSGIPCVRVELNLLDSQWRYPGSGDYRGLFKQLDITEPVLEQMADIERLAKEAAAVLDEPTLPAAQPGKQCSTPYGCPYKKQCEALEPPGPEHPIELLPDSAGKTLARKLKENKGYTSLLEPSEEELTGKARELYLRIQQAHRSGEPVLEPGAAAKLDALPWPRYFLDFEGIDLAVPRWKGVRPYEQIPFQWSCHVETAPGDFSCEEFIDFSGKDPSLGCIEALRQAIAQDGGPIFVYFATYERGRLKELAERHPEHAELLEGYIARLVDLLPLVKAHYYHPKMRGSFSIKKVLPTIAPDLDYEELDGVQDGTGAQLAYIGAALSGSMTAQQRAQTEHNARVYCRQDTWAMVEVAWFLQGGGRPVRQDVEVA